MSQLHFDSSHACDFITEKDFDAIKPEVLAARDTLLGRQGAGSDFLGWLDLPVDYDQEEFGRIQKAAEEIRSHSDVLLVIGIGGSYLGARAAIEFLRHSFYNMVSSQVRKAPEIYFVGNNISGTYLRELTDVLEGKDFSVNVISKSGPTTEPGQGRPEEGGG